MARALGCRYEQRTLADRGCLLAQIAAGDLDVAVLGGYPSCWHIDLNIRRSNGLSIHVIRPLAPDEIAMARAQGIPLP
jgi:hypothetical protein